MCEIDRSAVFIVPMISRFFGQTERLSAVLEHDFLVAVLQQEVEFAEDLGEVAAVDLVDDEHVRLLGVFERCMFRATRFSGPGISSNCGMPPFSLGTGR